MRPTKQVVMLKSNVKALKEAINKTEVSVISIKIQLNQLMEIANRLEEQINIKERRKK